MRQLLAIAAFVLFVAPVVAAVTFVMRLSAGTVSAIALIGVGAVSLGLLSISIGITSYLYLSGQAKITEAQALGSAAQARQIHGWSPTTQTTNNTFLVMHRGEEAIVLDATNERAAQWVEERQQEGYRMLTSGHSTR